MKPRFFAPLPAFVSRYVSYGVLGTSLLLCPSITAANPVVPAPVAATSNTAQEATLLARYQLALDQLSTGATGTARVILEDTVRRYGPRPEINLLLAYVLQREGNNNGALTIVNQVAPTSALAVAFSTQLQSAMPVVGANVGATNGTGVSSALAGLPGEMTSALVGTVPLSTAPKTNASLPQNDARLTKLELAMRDMVNAERAKTGLGALQWNDDLASVARAHSAEMRDKTYFSHESPTLGLTTHLDRYRAAGYESPRIIAENIFRAWGSPKQVSLTDIQSGHEALMQSPGHRANILFRDITQIGIGVATNTKGDLWITQMFLRP